MALNMFGRMEEKPPYCGRDLRPSYPPWLGQTGFRGSGQLLQGPVHLSLKTPDQLGDRVRFGPRPTFPGQILELLPAKGFPPGISKQPVQYTRQVLQMKPGTGDPGRAAPAKPGGTTVHQDRHFFTGLQESMSDGLKQGSQSGYRPPKPIFPLLRFFLCFHKRVPAWQFNHFLRNAPELPFIGYF